MKKIVLIGCGALGSTFLNEYAKTCFARTLDYSILVIDGDKVEARNVAAQNFKPSDIGKYKTDATLESLASYELNLTNLNTFVTEENFLEVLGDSSLIIDAVDNFETRQLLCKLSMITSIPVMHTAMSETGFGQISWTAPDFDTFPLSPLRISEAEIEAFKLLRREEGKKPPCELNGLRGMILNTAIATLNCLFMFQGIDLGNWFPDLFKGMGGSKGLMSNWTTTKESIILSKEPYMFGVANIEN